MKIYYSADEAENVVNVEFDEVDLKQGIENLVKYIIESAKIHKTNRKRACLFALDGYLGIEWERVLKPLEELSEVEDLKMKAIDFSQCYKSLDKIAQKCLSKEKSFGYVYSGKIIDVLDKRSVKKLKKDAEKLRKTLDLLVIFGPGTAIPLLRRLYDKIFYFDITRESLFNASLVRPIYFLGSKNRGQLLNQNFRRFYYVDSQILDKHKRRVLKYMDWYVECNNVKEVKMISRRLYYRILSRLAEKPFRIKPLYYPVVWGGNFLKKIKRLPEEMPNSGQACIVPDENSVKIRLGSVLLEIPFQNVLWANRKKILGEYVDRKFNGAFPFVYWYDDQIDGGHMAIQVHPNGKYLKKHFNERQIRQDESYYIISTGPGAKTYLGLQDDADVKEFYMKARESERTGKRFDYEKYVNYIWTKPGDYFLIPAGTVHASGRNQFVLEIDFEICAYSPGYTFHIYDYVRPDLDGSLRPIHLKHAFNVLKKNRRRKWVLANLAQQPKLLRSGDGWAEYLIGKRRDICFETRRLEFSKSIEDNTNGRFHLLTLVEGERVLVKPKKGEGYVLEFPDTLIVPACVGEYMIENLGEGMCKVVKALIP